MAESEANDVFYDTVSEVEDLSSINDIENQVNRIGLLEQRVRNNEMDNHWLTQQCSLIEERLYLGKDDRDNLREEFLIFKAQQREKSDRVSEIRKFENEEYQRVISELRETIAKMQEKIDNLEKKIKPHTPSSPTLQLSQEQDMSNASPSPVETQQNANPTAGVKKISPFDLSKVHELTQEDLRMMSAKTAIRSYLKQVKATGTTQEEWVAGAMFKLDKKLRLAVEREMKDKEFATIEDLEKVLLKMSSSPKSAEEAYDILIEQKFKLDDDPKAFVQDFKMKYREICNEFPDEKLPKEEIVWKGLIVDALPREIKPKLRKYMSEGLENRFLLEVERELNYYSRGRVAKVSNPASSQPNYHQTTQPPKTPMMRCGWCQDGSRHPREMCPRKPDPYSCFDCLAPNKMKGHDGCVGFCDSRLQRRPQNS